MKKEFLLATVILAGVASVQGGVFNVCDYGAVGDGNCLGSAK